MTSATRIGIALSRRYFPAHGAFCAVSRASVKVCSDSSFASSGGVQSVIIMVLLQIFKVSRLREKARKLTKRCRSGHTFCKDADKRVLNNDLEETFRRWYPAFRGKTEAKAA